MRFQKSFSRSKGAGTFPALGSDGTATTPPATIDVTLDNFFTDRCYSNQGWPAHRVAVSYKGPAAAIGLLAQLWLYDHETSAWYGPGAPVTILPNRINYFDVVALLDGPTTSSTGGFSKPSAGGIEALLVVEDAATPVGTYTFAIGADLTTLPL